MYVYPLSTALLNHTGNPQDPTTVFLANNPHLGFFTKGRQKHYKIV